MKKKSSEINTKIAQLEFNFTEIQKQISELDSLNDKKLSKIGQKNQENYKKLEHKIKSKADKVEIRALGEQQVKVNDFLCSENILAKFKVLFSFFDFMIFTLNTKVKNLFLGFFIWIRKHFLKPFPIKNFTKYIFLK